MTQAENSPVRPVKGKDSAQMVEQEMQFISIRLGEESFGVEIERIKEILKIGDITPVPKAPEFFLGIMNLRGSIIPVLDLKKRLGIPRIRGEENQARILVLQWEGDLHGVLVDEVSEVQRVSRSAIQPPPQMTRGIDRFYLSGVVQTGPRGSGRLVMMLNLREVLSVELGGARRMLSQMAGADQKRLGQVAVIEEEQAVTFMLGQEEFAIDISAIKEILKVEDVTAVPNVPAYVIGIQNVRDRIIPIVDMRRIVHVRLDQDWLADLNQFQRGLVAQGKGTCKEHWNALWQQWEGLSREHPELKMELGRLVDQAFPADGSSLSDKEFQALVARLEAQLKVGLSRDNRVLIVEVMGTTVGLMVDRVSEVLRVPRNLIDSTPVIIATYGREIRGVAKLDGGKRLILILNEEMVLTKDDAEALSHINEDMGLEEETVSQVKVAEKRMVIFSILGEEFGVEIEQVQEIYKARDITPVPKAPAFIKGVTNLRGSIIPVLDIRERFGLQDISEELMLLLGRLREKVESERDTFAGNLHAENPLAGLARDMDHTVLGQILQSHKTDNEQMTHALARITEGYEAIFERMCELRDVEYAEDARAEGLAELLEDAYPQYLRFLDQVLETRGEGILAGSEKLLVVTVRELKVGLLVDGVHEVLRLQEDQIEDAPPLVLSSVESSYLRGIAKLQGGERIILLLEVDNIMDEQEYRRLQKLKMDSEQKVREREAVPEKEEPGAQASSGLTPSLEAQAGGVLTGKTDQAKDAPQKRQRKRLAMED